MYRVVLGAVALGAAASVAVAAECTFEPIAEGAELTLARPVAGSVLREFGETYDEATGKKAMYQAVDLEAASGGAVYAARSGVVVEAGTHEPLGNYVRIDHGGGLVTGYGHLARVSVRRGSCVKGGQEIGKAGASGVAPGPQVALRGSARRHRRRSPRFLRIEFFAHSEGSGHDLDSPPLDGEGLGVG